MFPYLNHDADTTPLIGAITTEIKKCIQNECYLTALMAALTLPDICGRAEYPNASVTSRYIDWYNEYVGKYENPNEPETEDIEMSYISGEVAYNLRNSILHQGNPNIDTDKIKEESCKVNRFLLTIDHAMNGGSCSVEYEERDGKKEISHREIKINIVNLCMKLIAIARRYYKENKEKFDFFEYNFEYLKKEAQK